MSIVWKQLHPLYFEVYSSGKSHPRIEVQNIESPGCGNYDPTIVITDIFLLSTTSKTKQHYSSFFISVGPTIAMGSTGLLARLHNQAHLNRLEVNY